ncbi:MAG TPA: transglycosylase SLT domain-containing protein [Burkholderiales bacterium]|nr:transglycosylase SLT domain-containing protein [Burkholderiales bacterium]
MKETGTVSGITRHLSAALSALRDLFALAGAAAILAYLVLPLRDPLERALPIVLPSLPSVVIDQAVAAAGATMVADSPLGREQQAVAEFIAKRYRIADDVVGNFVAIAYRAGDQHRVDPLLILAVMAIESRYNPVAESVMGARGLMQIIPRYHPEKLEPHGGEQVLLDPEVNILVGAQILREYYRRFGDLETALQMYAGALDEPTSQYANKVLAEKARLDLLRVKSKKIAQSA